MKETCHSWEHSINLYPKKKKEGVNCIHLVPNMDHRQGLAKKEINLFNVKAYVENFLTS
jgi:hypothetical protein